jgi:predicted AAA+ superfamily ATPase
MPKPGRREDKPSQEIARFTNRDDHRARVRFHLTSPTEPPVLVFYGIGGAGKTWLLKKLRLEIPADIPTAYLDFDPQFGGARFLHDPAAALYDIRTQFGADTPRFDLAFAMLRHK